MSCDLGSLENAIKLVDEGGKPVDLFLDDGVPKPLSHIAFSRFLQRYGLDLSPEPTPPSGDSSPHDSPPGASSDASE